jgi:hypothetical protein
MPQRNIISVMAFSNGQAARRRRPARSAKAQLVLMVKEEFRSDVMTRFD